MAGAAPTAKPAPFLRPLDVLDRGVLLAESALSLVIVTGMVVFAVAEAAAAAAGIQSDFLSTAAELLMHGTIWAAFLGASFATRGRKHLAIDAIGRLLPDRARRVVVGISSTLGAVVAFSLARGIFDALSHAAADAAAQIQRNEAQGIADAFVDRSYQFDFIIPGGFLLIALRLLLHGIHEFMAAVRTAPIAPPPAAGAEAPKIPEDAAIPAEAKIPEERETRVAPVSQASGLEIVIALVALIALLAVCAGTTVMPPMSVAILGAALVLGIPLILRWRKTKSMAPTAPTPGEIPSPPPNPKEIGVAVVGVGLTLSLAYVGIKNIPEIPIWAGVAFFGLMAFMGAPLFTFLGGLALFLWAHGTAEVEPMSLANAVEDVLGLHFAKMSVLPTIPIFTLAGYLLSESKAPQRLVRVSRAFLGWMPGGLAAVCVLASGFFTVFSGASGITIVAVGGLLLPALLKDKYPERFSLGMVTTGGALGITLPLCLPLIVYGIVAGLQETPPGVEKLELQKFMFAGVIPGFLLMGLLIVYSMIVGWIAKVPRAKFDLGEAGAALWDAKWELLLPVVPVVGLLTGFFSPVGAAAFTAFYVLIIETFVYKDLSLTRDLPRIIPDSMVLVGAIFVKLCAATVLTCFFVQAQTAEALFEWLTCGDPAKAYLAAHADSIGTCREAVDALATTGQSAGGIIDSPLTFLIALNIFLLIVGMLMDIFSAIVVMVPLIMGIALHFDIDPYHLGIIFLLNLEIGYLMPPMGLNLFIAGFRFNRPVPDLYRVVLPFIGFFVIALMLTTYVPELTTVMVPGREDRVEAPVGPEPDVPIPTADVDAGPAAGPSDCDEQREDESFEDFDRRCNITGSFPPPDAGPAAPAGGGADCDQPRENESFDDFNARCHITE